MSFPSISWKLGSLEEVSARRTSIFFNLACAKRCRHWSLKIYQEQTYIRVNSQLHRRGAREQPVSIIHPNSMNCHIQSSPILTKCFTASVYHWKVHFEKDLATCFVQVTTFDKTFVLWWWKCRVSEPLSRITPKSKLQMHMPVHCAVKPLSCFPWSWGQRPNQCQSTALYN